MLSNDTEWRLLAVELAAKEQLSIKGSYELDKLFLRAKEIYDRGYEEGLETWKTIWTKEVIEKGPQPLPAVKPKETPKTIVNAEEKKICHKCGESIPKKWKEHLYKKDGSVCGQTFGDLN